MTDELDEMAREIVKSQYPEMRDDYKGRRLTIARLALEAGMKLQSERCRSRNKERQAMTPNPDQIYVPVKAVGMNTYDNGGDLVATCKNPRIAEKVAELLNKDAKP